MLLLVEADTPQGLFGAGRNFFGIDSVDTSEQAEILADRQVFVQRKLLAHVADSSFYFLALCPDIESHHLRFPFGR